MDIRHFFSKKRQSDDAEHTNDHNDAKQWHPDGLSPVEEATTTTPKGLDEMSSTDLNVSKHKDDVPVQPRLSEFPKTNNRKFSFCLYSSYAWIEYSTTQDSVLCFPCRHFAKNIVHPGEKLDSVAFVDYGSRKWRDIRAVLNQHAASQKHISSMSAWSNYKKIKENENLSIANVISSSRQAEIEENRKHVGVLLSATSYLGPQGLPFRGHDEATSSANCGNFTELIHVFAQDNPQLKAKISQRYGHYTSPQYQNDLISTFGHLVKKRIVDHMLSNPRSYFSLLVDETKDISRKEQLSVVIRFVAGDGYIQERSLGCCQVKETDANSLCEAIFTILRENHIDVTKCIAQCYDGASVMSGVYSGVQTRIREYVPHAIYIHCYAHRLNLVLVQTNKDIPIVSGFFKLLQAIYVFISTSNVRHELFVAVQQEKGIQVLELERLIDTRWSYWYTSVRKVMLRFSEIKETLAIVSESDSRADSVARAEAVGYLREFSSTKCLTFLHTVEKLLSLVNSLSTELQSSTLNLPTALTLIKTTRTSLLSLRNEKSWREIQDRVKKQANGNGIESAVTNQNRQRSISSNLMDFYVESTIGKQISDHDAELKVDIFYTLIERFLSEMDRRFINNIDLLTAISMFQHTAPNYFSYSSACTIANHYSKHGVDSVHLESQLESAKHFIKSTNASDIHDIRSNLVTLPCAYAEVLKLIDIILTLPVTTASCERFFSSLKRVKTYLRSTCGNERLSDLLLMSVEKEEDKKIDLQEAISHFSKMKPRRYPLL